MRSTIERRWPHQETQTNTRRHCQQEKWGTDRRNLLIILVIMIICHGILTDSAQCDETKVECFNEGP